MAEGTVSIAGGERGVGSEVESAFGSYQVMPRISPDELRAQIAQLRKLAGNASSEAEAREIISRIARISRAYRVQNGIGLPLNPALQAREIDPTFRIRPHIEYLSNKIAEAVRDVENGKSRRLIVSMPPRAGKECADYTPILTENKGWITHGQVVPGDRVFAPSGRSVQVTAVNESALRPKMRVTFTDGSSVDVHPNHEWSVYDRARGAWRIMETREIAARTLWPKGLRGVRGARAVIQIPNSLPLQMPERDLPIDPYTLGAWLGDGSSSAATVCGAVEDLDQILSRFPYELGARWVHKTTGVHYQYVKGGFLRELRERGLLNNKHIPEEYLLASESQRRALLAGLVDTDGHVDKTNRVTVISSNKRLAEDVQALVRTLGYRAGLRRIAPDSRDRAIRGGESWAVAWTQADGTAPGTLPRKSTTKVAPQRRLGIASIEEVEPVPGKCIEVEGGMYLVGRELIPTHNSTLTSLWAPLWILRRHPEWKFMMASYDGALTTNWARQQRTLIEDRPDLGIALQRDGGAGGKWATLEKGGMFATGVGGAMTGRGAKVMLIDDPIADFVSAHSPRIRDNLWNWWLSVAQTRLEPPSLVIVVMCMTGDTPVLRPDGSETALRDIRPGDEIATFTDEGEVTTSVVSNWVSQGVDDIFAVRLASGRVVKANARHPFWVIDEEGNGSWVRLESLRAGMKVRSLEAPTEESSAPQTAAISPRSARACACPTTPAPGTLQDIDLPQRLTRDGGRSGSRVVTQSRLRTTTASSQSRMSDVPSVEGTSPKSPSRPTGQKSSASTTATAPESCEACSATTATSSLLAATRLTSFGGPLSTSVVSTDEVVSVEPAGREEVFDIEVVGTHRFIANGLDVSNTRWHEDDFVGRLLSKEYEGDPSEWEEIVLPAIADRENDPLGRSIGEPLFSPLPSLDHELEQPDEAVRRWDKVKVDVGTYTFACTPAESPVLMADWTNKTISEVCPGDEVLGWVKGTPEARATLTRATVKRVMRYRGEVQTMTLASGETVRCTPDHRWYTGRRATDAEPHRKEYAPASVGSSLLRVEPKLPAWSSLRQRDLDWIAGILDGEGHFRSNVITITQSSIANPDVYARIKEVLDRLGWDYREELREPEYANSFRIRDTRAVIHELAERTSLAKIGRALRAQWSSPRKPVRERDKVMSISPGVEEDVYALETTTGNYVVWGYASSNSMYQQRPAPQKGAIFDAGWWRFWTTDPARATEDGRIIFLDPGGLIGGLWLDSWDTAFKASEDSSWVVAQRWVKQGPNRYLITQKRGRWSFTATIKEMKAWAATDDHKNSPFGRFVHKRLIEEKANGAAIIDTLRKEISGMKAINPRTSKEARARAITPEVESGHVYLPHPLDPGNEWVTDLLSELRNFPHDANDDQVDTLTQALEEYRDDGVGGVTVPGRAPAPGVMGRSIPRNIAKAASTMNRRIPGR